MSNMSCQDGATATYGIMHRDHHHPPIHAITWSYSLGRSTLTAFLQRFPPPPLSSLHSSSSRNLRCLRRDTSRNLCHVSPASARKIGKEPDTELTVLDNPSRSTTGSTGDDPEAIPPRQKDLVYVEGVKNDSGPVGPAIERLWRKRNHGLSLDDIATQPSVFDDDKLAPLYQPGP